MSTVLIFHSNYESVKMETEPSRKFRRFPASCKKSHLVVPYINSVKRNNTNQFYQILIFFFFLISYTISDTKILGLFLGIFPVGTRFSARPDRPRGPPNLLYNGYGAFPGGIGGLRVGLTPHPIQCRGPRKSSTIPVLTLRVFVAYKKGETYLRNILSSFTGWLNLGEVGDKFTVYC